MFQGLFYYFFDVIGRVFIPSNPIHLLYTEYTLYNARDA